MFYNKIKCTHLNGLNKGCCLILNISLLRSGSGMNIRFSGPSKSSATYLAGDRLLVKTLANSVLKVIIYF